MLTKEQKTELYERLNIIRNDIRELNNEQNKLHAEKEEAFNKRENNKKEISSLAYIMDDSKKKRDVLTKEVKDIKASMIGGKELLKGRVEQIRERNKQRKGLVSKYNLNRSLGEIKQRIDALEFKIETEGMHFSKEQELMKEIKKLKIESKKCEEIGIISNNIKEHSKEINQLKAERDSKYKKMQETADLSQNRHKEMVDAFKKIKELRKNEKEAHQNFVLLKEQFKEINNKLNNKVEEADAINDILCKDKIELNKIKKEKESSMLKSMQKEVEDKLKAGMKLTTEDLLIIQNKI